MSEKKSKKCPKTIVSLLTDPIAMDISEVVLVNNNNNPVEVKTI